LIKKTLKILSIGVLLLLLVIVGATAWVLGTEKGLEQSLAVAKKYAPGELQWQQAAGKFTGPLQILGLQYVQNDGLEVQLGDIAFDWLPSKLARGAVEINQLHLSDVTVKLPETREQSAQDTTSTGLPDIALPLSIALNDILLSNLEVYPAGADTPIEISEVALSAQMTRSQLSISTLQVSAPQGQLQLAGDITTADTYPMDLSLDWLSRIEQASPLQGKGTIVGDLAGEQALLQIEHQVSGLASAEISATLSNVLSESDLA